MFYLQFSAPVKKKQSNVLQFLREDSYNINNYYIDHILDFDCKTEKNDIELEK